MLLTVGLLFDDWVRGVCRRLFPVVLSLSPLSEIVDIVNVGVFSPFLMEVIQIECMKACIRLLSMVNSQATAETNFCTKSATAI